jgi:hypothetical protein
MLDQLAALMPWRAASGVRLEVQGIRVCRLGVCRTICSVGVIESLGIGSAGRSHSYDLVVRGGVSQLRDAR